ncbi:hypothetical protein LCM08_00560 [Salipiger pacificus]|nr:hypothetical protein [Alloyangia pacifica]
MKALLDHIQRQQNLSTAVADILEALQALHESGPVDRNAERQLLGVAAALALTLNAALDSVNLPSTEGVA